MSRRGAVVAAIVLIVLGAGAFAIVALRDPTAAEPPPHVQQPGELAVVIDADLALTITKASFAALATLTIDSARAGTTPAIDLEHGLGLSAELVSYQADGQEVAAAAPAPGARPVVFMSRRDRFKLAWVDASGAILGPRVRELTRVTLRTR